jgi:hypothetical protein
MHLLSMFVIVALLVGTLGLIGSMLVTYAEQIMIALSGESLPVQTARIFEFKPRRGEDFRAVEPLPLAA